MSRTRPPTLRNPGIIPYRWHVSLNRALRRFKQVDRDVGQMTATATTGWVVLLFANLISNRQSVPSNFILDLTGIDAAITKKLPPGMGGFQCSHA